MAVGFVFVVVESTQLNSHSDRRVGPVPRGLQWSLFM